MKCIICGLKIEKDKETCKVCEELMDYIHEENVEIKEESFKEFRKMSRRKLK